MISIIDTAVDSFKCIASSISIIRGGIFSDEHFKVTVTHKIIFYVRLRCWQMESSTLVANALGSDPWSLVFSESAPLPSILTHCRAVGT